MFRNVIIPRKTVSIAALIILFALALRTPYLLHKMQDIDEGSHAAVAAILMDGGLPYLDAVNNKPPGIWYIYLATFFLFGKYNMLAIHAVTFLWTLATAIVLSVLAKNLAGKSAALLTLLFYLTFSTALYPKMIAGNSEIFMALPYSLAALFLWRGCAGGKGIFFFAAGCASGLALLIKQVSGAQAAAVFVYMLGIIPLLSGGRKILSSILAFVKYGIGFALPVGAVAFLFHLYGVLDDEIFWNITYPNRYISYGYSNLRFTSQLLAEFVPYVLSTLILWALCLLWIKNTAADFMRREKPAGHFPLFLILWLAASAAASMIGNRMYGHYFIQILPPLSLTAALFAGKFFDETGPPRRKYWKAAILALTVIPGIVFLGMAISFEAVTDTWGAIKPDFRPATEYIKEHTDPEDKIFVWGWFTPVYVYSERTPATRFVFTTMHTGYKKGDDPNEKDRADISWLYVPESWPMLEQDLRRNRPELIVDTSPGDYHNFGRYPIRDYPVLQSFVDQNCRLEKSIAGMDIYRCASAEARTGRYASACGRRR